MHVRDILRKKSVQLITIRQNESLLEASRLLVEHRVGVLVVMTAQNEPVGILSERDIVREFARQGKDSATVTVENVMTKDLIVGVPDDDLSYVMNVMTQQRIRHVPILDGQQMVGLVSIGDVVKAQINEAETEIRYLNSYITGTPTG